MDIDAFESFLLADEAKSPSTTDNMLRCLRRMMVSGFQPSEDRNHYAAYLARHRNRGRSEHKNAVAVANALLRWRGIKDPFPFPKKKRSQPVRLKDWEIQRLKRFGHRDPLLLLRNRALVDFALQTGLRRGEVARFNARDFDPDARTLHIPLPSKNGLVRTIPIDRDFTRDREPFMSWLRARPIIPNDPDAVWIGMANGRPAQRMTPRKVGNLMGEIGRSVGVRANFRRTRHTRATELLGRGLHVRHLQHYLGHATLNATMVYLEVGDDDLQGAWGQH